MQYNCVIPSVGSCLDGYKMKTVIIHTHYTIKIPDYVDSLNRVTNGSYDGKSWPRKVYSSVYILSLRDIHVSRFVNVKGC